MSESNFDEKAKKYCPWPFSILCGSAKVRNRQMMFWGLLTFFALIWRHPHGWPILNYLLPAGALLEFTSLQQGIVQDVFTQRSHKYLALNNELNESLNNKWATLLIMTVYHFVYLLMPDSYNLLGIIGVYLFAVSFKIFRLCQFVSNKERLADLYKKNPEQTQKDYDQEISKKVDVTITANEHQLKTAKDTMKQSIKDSLPT